MAQGVSIKGSMTIADWEGPFKGILRDLVPQKIPQDALYDGLNVVFRNGMLIARPGLTKLTTTDLGSRVTGANQTALLASGVFDPIAFDTDTFQESGNTPGTVIAAGSNRKFWGFFGGAWHDLTDVALTATDTSLAQFTNIQIGTNIFTLMTNGIDNPRQWDNASATISPVVGSPPLFSDWCTASDRIVGIVPPYLIQWGQALSITNWPASNFRVLSDTADTLVAIENLGTLGVAVYKRNSIWVGIAQGGLDASYFVFQLRGQYEGPANPCCIVNVSGSHYFMTLSGRIGVFDGVRLTWINDPVLPLLRQTLDNAGMARAFGVYDPTNREVWFFYPRLAESGSGNVTGLHIVSIPKTFSYEGIQFHAGYIGQMALPVTAGVDRRQDLGDYLVFGQNGGQNLAYNFAPNISDDGIAFTGFWQSPIRGAATGMKGPWDVHRAIGVETYAGRGPGFGSLTMQIVSNYMMGSQSNLSAGVTIDLATEPTHANAIDFGVKGRFFGLRYSFTSPTNLAWFGSRLMGVPVE